MGRLILIGGGARSGKSRLALALAADRGARRGFIATAERSDDEMRSRIDRHIAERGDAFDTVEAPLDPAAALAAMTAVDVVVIDCVTLWLSNLLLQGADDAVVEEAVARLADAIAAHPADVVVVTNEVGLGLVPPSELGRRFRDLAGRAHQLLAARAAEVYAGVIGLMLRLVPGPVEVVTAPSTGVGDQNV